MSNRLRWTSDRLSAGSIGNGRVRRKSDRVHWTSSGSVKYCLWAVWLVSVQCTLFVGGDWCSWVGVVTCGCWALFMGTGSFMDAGLLFVGTGLSSVVGRAHLCAVHIVCGWGLSFVAMVMPWHLHVVTISKIIWNKCTRHSLSLIMWTTTTNDNIVVIRHLVGTSLVGDMVPQNPNPAHLVSDMATSLLQWLWVGDRCGWRPWAMVTTKVMVMVEQGWQWGDSGWVSFGGGGGWRREWHYNICHTANTVPFWLIWLSHVIGPVVFSHLPCVTTPMANNFWWVQKMIKKAFKNISMGVDHMQHFFLLVYSRRTLIDQWEI